MNRPTSQSPLFTPVIASLIALASVVFLGKSYESSLRGIDSNIHAAVSMSVTSGPGLSPRLPIPIKNFSAAAAPLSGSRIDPNRVFNDHPFFIFWLNGLIMRALGPSGWSARLLTGAFSVGSVLLTLAIGKRLVSRVFGVVSALLLIFCRDFVLTSATVSLDTALVFFILLTFYLWLKQRWFALGIAAGVGLWVKTPIVLLVFPVALIIELGRLTQFTQRGRLDRLGLLRKTAWLFGAGVLSIAVGSLIWIYTAHVGGWELVQDYWARQFWGTAVGGRGAQAQGWDWGRFFFYNLRTGFLPGLPLLVIGLARIAHRNTWKHPSVSIPLLATGVIGFVVTALRFKLGHYFTPIFPFLALLAAHSVSPWLERREDRFYATLLTATPLLLGFLLIWPVSFGPEAFVALRRFTPLIQTQGTCDDIIALVPGGEPVGSDLDYSLFLNFYTGRTIEVVSCGQLSERLTRAPRPKWAILSEENRNHCLTPATQDLFPSIWRVGTQNLLAGAGVLDGKGVTDLTPLELDHLAVIDCQAPRYPQDLWHKYLSSP